MSGNDEKKKIPLSAVEESSWGQDAASHFGYANDEERRAKRGLEDWELVEKIPESQAGIPFWFLSVILTVLLVAVGLSFPFWGDRPGYERAWVDWGFGAALVYVTAASALVYYMVKLYGSKDGGRLDSDTNKEGTDEPDQNK